MPESQQPLISIIIPSYKQGRFMRGCIESILAQSHRPLEILVVDGASPDETVEVLRGFADTPEVRWISEPDDGPASAVNKGLAMAKGEIVGIQSVDDYYHDGALALAAEQFSADPELGILYGEAETISADGRSLSISRRPPHRDSLCIALCVCIPQSSAFFRPALARELGGWRSEYFTCDWDLWLRMMFRVKVSKIDALLSARRVYPDQRTAQRDTVRSSFLAMLDDCAELRQGGMELRRADLAARQLIHYYFNPDSSRFTRLLRLLGATLLFPQIWPYVRNKKQLIPGWQRGMRQLNRLKPFFLSRSH